MAGTGSVPKRRRHTCPVCEQCFVRTEHLTRHIRRHTSSKPYQCILCSQCFARKETHDRHQHKQHGELEKFPRPRIVGSLERPSDEVLREQLGHLIPHTAVVDEDVVLIEDQSDEFGVNLSPSSLSSNAASLPSLSASNTIDTSLYSYDGNDPVFSAATFVSHLPPASNYQLSVIHRMRNAMISSLREYDIYTENDIPGSDQLDKYQTMFFAVPNRNLPFMHESTPILANPVAINLGLIGNGAIYCGNWDSGIKLLEASRRLVSAHLDDDTAERYPLWVLNTLMINTVFGFPGGDEPSTNVTRGHLRSILWVAARVRRPPAAHYAAACAPVEDQWQMFIAYESWKRSLWCILIIVGLWSTAFGVPEDYLPPIYQTLELPCPEGLWLVTSAQDWKELSDKALLPRDLWSTIDELSAGRVHPASGLTSLCLVVGILLRSVEVQKMNTADEDANHFVREALNYWQESHSMRFPFNHATNYIVFPAVAYIYLSYEVNTTEMMEHFLGFRFDELRVDLRKGRLIEAAPHACHALVPWTTQRRNRTSMVYIPCAIVVIEAFMLLDEQHSSPSTANEWKRQLGIAEVETDLCGIWTELRRRIANGPVTQALVACLSAYATTFTPLEQSR